MKSVEQRLQELEDDSAIRSLVSRFADAAMTAHYEEFGDLWTENGRWTIHEPFFLSSEGVSKINEMLVTLRTGKTFFVQFVHSGVIKLDGDRASARWIMRETSEGPGTLFYNNYAIYVDSLVRLDGQWKFASRDYHYMWIDTGAFPGDVFDLPPLPKIS